MRAGDVQSLAVAEASLARAPACAAVEPIQPGQRLVVFTGDLSYTVRRNIVDLDARIRGLSWLVLVHSPRKTLHHLLKSQRFNLRKNGWRWIPYQLGNLVERLVPPRPSEPDPGAPGSEYGLAALRARANVHICSVADIHADESLALVREFSPDLGLSLAAPILRPTLFALPRLGTINLHKGKLPEFRGMPPAFWEIWTDQASVGCSVHWVNEKLDEGALLGHSELARARWSTPRGLQLGVDELGIDLVCQVAEEVLNGSTHAQPQAQGVGMTYRKPTLVQQAELTRRLARLEPHKQVTWKRVLKDVFAHCTFAWQRWIAWRVATPRITVLLYHRVCDDARDNLSVGVAQFERQMQLLREYCEVLSIEQVLACGAPKRSRRPLVAVSFDDGYLDNYQNAVPILRRHRVPCSFYVSTGIVASERRFPHDVRRGNARIPVMSWDQLRQMRAWGFTIGSHTVSHIDCVAETEARVRQELMQSRDDLVRELGPMEPIFAYPYGGRHQINDERLALVREAGYHACLAAFGGSNIGTVDRWKVLRRGIHWEFSDATFLQQCLGR